MDVRTPVPTIYGDFLAQFGDAWRKQVEILRAKFGASIEDVRMPGETATDLPIVYVTASALLEVFELLKTHPDFDYSFLTDLTATDEGQDRGEPRFDVVYHLFSPTKKARIRIKVKVREDEAVPSLTTLWPAANWPEREVWDMFGIRFQGHPDLRRILMDSRWVGHPLRKDYPLRGYQIFPSTEPVEEKLLD
jgi:NADH-quinone oxidoreductase subunit C